MTNDLIDRAKAAQEGVTPGLEAALRSYSQADYEGVMVTVSRQACEEGADAIAAARQLVPDLIAAIEARDARIAELERKYALLDGEYDTVLAGRSDEEARADAAEAKYIEAEQRRMEAAERIVSLEDAVDEFRAVNADLEARVKVLEDALAQIGLRSPVKEFSDAARAALKGEK